MESPRCVNGVLDLRRTDFIPLIKVNIVIGDTFTRVFGLREAGGNYTGATAALYLYSAKPPTGDLIYNDVTIPLHDIVIPSSPDEVGSGSFTISIPAHITAGFATTNTPLYGACRLLKPDGTISTIFSLQVSLVFA
jgi:hypothetical protein